MQSVAMAFCPITLKKKKREKSKGEKEAFSLIPILGGKKKIEGEKSGLVRRSQLFPGEKKGKKKKKGATAKKSPLHNEAPKNPFFRSPLPCMKEKKKKKKKKGGGGGGGGGGGPWLPP